MFGLGLKEAKNLVESAPCKIAENLPMDDIEEKKAKLEALGCEVAIV